MSKRVVITGLGVVSPVGTGKNDFWSNLVSGQSGIKKIELFDTSGLNCKMAGEITDFDGQKILDGTNVVALDRTAQLVCAAVKLGIDDAGLDWPATQKSRTGIIIGGTFGHMHTYSLFDRTQLGKGFLAASAKDFANSVAITNVGHASVLFGMEAFNGLVSMGQSSSLGAVNLAASYIDLDRADLVVAGGAESLFIENFLQFYLPEQLSGSRAGESEFCAPFDRKRNGMVLGEGSAVVVLEEYEHAMARGAKIYSEILGFGTAFDPQFANRPNPAAKGMTRAMKIALGRAELSSDKIDYVCLNGNSSVVVDETEAAALRNVFGSTSNRFYSAIKSMTGECFSASGALQLCASAMTLNSGVVPPTINYRDPDPTCALPLVTRSQEGDIRTAIINTMDDSGIAASLVIGNAPGTRRAA